MNVIMQKFYHPAKLQGEARIPHILGLTASPVMSAKAGTLETIESNLDAKAITPKIHRSELEKYVHPPEVICVCFDASTRDVSSGSVLLHGLKHAVNSYDLSMDPYARHLRDVGQPVLVTKTRCLKELKALKNRADDITEQLGVSAAEWFINTCIEKFVSTTTYQPLVSVDVAEQERRHLQIILKNIMVHCGVPSETATQSIHITAKVESLAKMLNDVASLESRAIVFVEQRAVVSALATILLEHSLIPPSWRIGTFVGTSSFSKRDNALANLAEPKEQQQDLSDFRSGKKNLMIATNVLEEGIDVSACNLVICFDLPKNLVSFIQRRGRARKQDSKYALFIPNQDCKTDPSKWAKFEAEMKEAYMNDARQQVINKGGEEDEELGDRQYRVAETGALLTLANAKAHLYHFCATSSLHNNRHVDLRPEFATTNYGGKTPWTAVTTLPSFVNLKIRTAPSSRAYHSEATAIKDAAFEAYVALHKECLVNNNLLPLRQDPQFHFVDQPSTIKICERLDPWKLALQPGKTGQVQWHATQLEINHGDQTIVAAALWLPVVLPPVQNFKLFWNENTTYTVRIRDARADIVHCKKSDLKQSKGAMLVLTMSLL